MALTDRHLRHAVTSQIHILVCRVDVVCGTDPPQQSTLDHQGIPMGIWLSDGNA
jgi:hypothetical protein